MKIPVLNIKQFQSSKEVHQVYVNSFANHIKINKQLISTPHSHNFYLCVIFTKGSGVHEIDFKSYAISPGKVFFLKPGQTHFWKFKTPPNGFIFFHSKIPENSTKIIWFPNPDVKTVQTKSSGFQTQMVQKFWMRKNTGHIHNRHTQSTTVFHVRA